MRGQLQAAQALGAQVRRQPGQHGAHMAALEGLFERPEAVGARNHAGAGVDDQQLIHIETELQQRAGRQRRRWVEQHHQPARLLRGDEAGCQQADFAHAGVRQQQFGEGAARPAATGQLGVERPEPAVHGRVNLPAESVGEPERGVQAFGADDTGLPRRPRGMGHGMRHCAGCRPPFAGRRWHRQHRRHLDRQASERWK
jgi:hypothetical protein